MANKKRIQIVIDQEDYNRLEEISQSNFLKVSTYCKVELLKIIKSKNEI